MNLWTDDGAEIYLDTQNNKITSMDSNDYYFIINVNDQTQSSGIISVTTPNINGYIMEIAIPWSVMNTIPSSGKTMGLLLGNNDRDNGNSSQFDWLDLIETGSYAHPNLWGDIVLSGTQTSEDAASLAPPRGTDDKLVHG